MSRSYLRLFWPLLALLLCAVWSYRDMHSIPTGNVNFGLANVRLNQVETWFTPLVTSPRRLRETGLDPGVTLTSISCSDSRRCWAVGKGGTILATRDGGQSWQAQANHFPNVLLSVTFLADSLRGWAVGHNGVILMTENGGQNWQAQGGNSASALSSVTFLADGLRGWVVGSNGAILATKDGGQSWQAQASNSKSHLISVNFLADGLHGWAVGEAGTIVATKDGGKSWQAQASNSTTSRLYSVTFLADGLHGWVVGGIPPSFWIGDGKKSASKTTILATKDGGQSWQAQANNSTSNLTSVTFLADGLSGWAVGQSGTILATKDGGKSWQAQASNSTSEFSCVTFLADGLHGWAVGEAGTIVATKDGGKSWQAQVSSTRDLASVTFLADGLHGWAVGWGGTILATKDGGQNWQAQASNSNSHLTSVTFLADGLRGWAVGNTGTIVATQDGGKSWQAQANNSTSDLISVTFLADGLRGWAVGNTGIIVATQDGGKSWQAQASNSTRHLASVTFLADGLHGWAVGEAGTIVATKDGGKSWQAQVSSTRDLASVTFLADGLYGWAVGWGGTILATKDGGQNWQAQASNSNSHLTSVTFLADGLRGWAVGNTGTIVATQDGGKSWQAQANNSTSDLTSVTFLADGLRGWAVGNTGTIVATQDGGKSWQAQASNSTRHLASVTFLADGLRGWAVGEAGTIVATKDGGQSWQAQASNSTSDFTSVTVLADGLRGWTVDPGGTIQATKDGGQSWQALSRNFMTPLASVTFLADGLRGWAVGWSVEIRNENKSRYKNKKTILATKDGGQHWLAQASNSTNDLASVTFLADGRHGWAVGWGGAILATKDGGQNWQAQASNSTSDLTSVAFLADGLRGWAVGTGIILATKDGGQNWQAQVVRNFPNVLTSVIFLADGMRGWAAGWNGTILVTKDGGQSWQAQASNSTSRLRSITFLADGLRGWAVGEAGTILATKDGGQTWADQSLHHVPGIDPRPRVNPQQWPSTAALVTMSASVLWLGLLLLRLSTDPEALRHHDAGGYHDNPIEHSAEDKLGTAPLARTLALLLRNQDTAPPLAVAVCARWGMGKSSLLRLLARELKTRGAHPIWFNAWHYRDDTQLLAALMEHLRDQAFPSGYSLQSLWFRMRMLWLRVLRPWVPVMGLLLVAYVSSVFWPTEVHQQVARQVAALWASIKTETWAGPLVAEFSNRFTSLLALLAAIWFATTQAPKAAVFSPKLEKLLKNGHEWFRARTEVADMKKDAGFRYLFQTEFGQVCKAMGRGRLVLIIDDLDRCDPAQIDKVMSTLNFLFNCAEFHAVLGMDWSYVRSAVGLAYKDIAKELNGSTDEKLSRQEFGEQFLEKIVQLRLNLPADDATPVVLRTKLAEQMATPAGIRRITGQQVRLRMRETTADSWRSLRQRWTSIRQADRAAWGKALGTALRSPFIGIKVLLRDLRERFDSSPPGQGSSLLGFALVGTAVWYGTQFLGEQFKPTGSQPLPTVSVTGAPAPVVTLPSTTATPQERDLQRAAAQGRAIPRWQPEPNQAWSGWWWGGLAGGLLAAVLWWAWAKAQIRDSDGFRDAMKAWRHELQPIIRTPRAWRRLQNMARFAAMRVRVAAGDDDGWRVILSRLQAAWTAWVFKTRTISSTDQQEALIVSLLAAQKREGQLVPMLQKRLAYLQSAALTALPVDDDDALKHWQAYLARPTDGTYPTKDEEILNRITSTDWWKSQEPVFSQLRASVEGLWSAAPPWCASAHSSRLLHLAEATTIGNTERQQLLDQVSRWEAVHQFSAIVQAVALVCHGNE